MPPPVFLSYARRASQAEARALRAALQAEGIEAFLDERDIAQGAPFPAGIAAGLLGARVAVLFASEAWLSRPWCVHELRLLSAPWRHGRDPAMESVVVALPAAGDLPAITAQLPPPLATASWPQAADTTRLVELVRQRLQACTRSFADAWQDLGDDALRAARSGADQPLAWAGEPPVPAQPAGPFHWLADMPSPRGDGFVGRAAALWQLVHELDTARAFTPARRVVVQGLGGSGKSLLAAEFVARHAARAFPSGVVWIDAAAGVDALLTAGLALWQHLAPGEAVPVPESLPAPRRWAVLSSALAQRLARHVPAGRMLWVIDGLPEPGAGDDLPPGGIPVWCPAPRHLSVLVTTRRADSLREADATLALPTLAADDALTLLTRPPVDGAWLAPDDWRAVVRWAGALPLVLALLRESLLSGGISIAALREAPGRDPADETRRVMDALRGEIDDRSLRGAAEAFELSRQALAGVPGLLAAAQRLALLGAAPIDEALLSAVAGAVDMAGRLVRRGWLQPAGAGPDMPAAASRSFRMHPVPASVLRASIDDPGPAFDATLAALRETIAQTPEDVLNRRRELHLMRVLDHLFARPPGSPGDAAALKGCVERFAVAAAVQAEPRGLRYLAARAADTAGAGDAMVAALRAATDAGDEGAMVALPHTLQGLPSTPAAMAWLGALMADPRARVRQAALVHAPAVPALLAAVFEAATASAASASAAAAVQGLASRFVEGPLLRDALAMAIRALSEDARPAARAVAAGMIGRALDLHGRRFEVGGFNASRLIARLLALAVDDPDAAARRACADAAACGDEPFADDAWAWLAGRVDTALDAGDRLRALEAAGAFLLQTRLPRAPRAASALRDDDGGVRLQVVLGAAGSRWPRDVVPRLAGWAVDPSDPRARRLAAATLLGDDQGPVELADWVYDHLEAHRPAPVRALADELLGCGVAHRALVNVRWWRAQAREALGDNAGALDDLEVVVRAMPSFEPARDKLLASREAQAQEAIAQGDVAGTLAHAQRAVELAPQQMTGHYLLAIGLLNQGRLPEAEASATRALSLRPDTAELHWLRGLARAHLGRRDDARADALRAVELDTAEPRYQALLEQLEQLQAG